MKTKIVNASYNEIIDQKSYYDIYDPLSDNDEIIVKSDCVINSEMAKRIEYTTIEIVVIVLNS